jgi:hypothetical protein
MELSPLTCTAEELYGIVARGNRTWLMLSLSNPAITEDHVVALLRNPAITPEIVHGVYERFEWASSYKIQFAIVSCAKTPPTLGLRLLNVLFWRDLIKVIDNFRLNPRLRIAAEGRVRERIPDLTLGEKKTLARTAPRALIPVIKQERDHEVFSALLQNPKLVEEDLVQLINLELTPAPILRIIGNERRWSCRYTIRLALVRNPRTPLPISLGLVSKLQKPDLRLIAASTAGAELVRRAAGRIVSGDY